MIAKKCKCNNAWICANKCFTNSIDTQCSFRIEKKDTEYFLKKYENKVYK